VNRTVARRHDAHIEPLLLEASVHVVRSLEVERVRHDVAAGLGDPEASNDEILTNGRAGNERDVCSLRADQRGEQCFHIGDVDRHIRRAAR